MIDHRDPWIGIPETFPFEGRWPTARDWATELVAILPEELGEPEPGQQAALLDYLEVLAESRASRHVSRIYILVTGWTGAVYVVDMAVIPTAALEGKSLEAFAGADDDSCVEKPLVEPFTTGSGLGGLLCTRFTDHEEFGGLLARADYVFPVPGAFVRLYTAQIDLIAFQRVLPRLRELALTVRVDD
jgi:hypothetical protein